MKKIVPLRISESTTVYVEMEEVEVPISVSGTPVGIRDLPAGSEAVSAIETALDAFSSLQEGIGEILSGIATVVADSKPSSWKVEVNIGFKGKLAPIPVILSGESDAAIKLQVEWKPTYEQRP